jgi:serine/threonine-protein kinase
MFAADQLVGDRYRLRERIAAGGMGEVWQARDERLLREIAVKVLHPEHADDDAFRARLRIEAQSAASVSSGNVVGVYDWGEQTDDTGRCVSYIVMELVLGNTVADLLRRDGQLDPTRTAQIVADAAAGLAAAHDRGIVHRDIKPANLLREADGRIKVADFGIARAKDRSALTKTGTLVGTARYLSPEQVLGQHATAASDIYSLGIVAYQCLSGDVPFRGDGDVATATARLIDPVPPLPATTPGVLDNLIMSMLDRDPARRPTARELAGAAGRAVATEDESSRTRLLPAIAAGTAETEALTLVASPTMGSRSLTSKPYALVGVALLLILVGVFAVPSLFDGTGSHGAAHTTTSRSPASTPSTLAASVSQKKTPPSRPLPASHTAVLTAAAAAKPTPPGQAHGRGHGHRPKPAKPPKPPKPGHHPHGRGPRHP